MKRLSAGQQLVKSYLGWRSSPPTFRKLLPGYALGWLLLAALVALLIFVPRHLSPHSDLAWINWLAVGLVLGAVLRDVGWIRRFLNVWPTLSRILDWQQVERHAAGNLTDEASAETTPSKPRLRRTAAIGLIIGTLLIGGLLGTDQVLMTLYDPRPGNPPDGVIIYTTAWCPYCAALRTHLRSSKVRYTEVDIEKSFRGSYAHRAIGGRGIPVTLVGQDVIRGFQAEKIDERLRRAGYQLNKDGGS